MVRFIRDDSPVLVDARCTRMDTGGEVRHHEHYFPTTADDMKEELKKLIVGRRGWRLPRCETIAEIVIY
jgi:hypothetical protein